MSLTLFNIGADHEAPGRDELDRYYTPPALARQLVEHMPGSRSPFLEPSVGDGAWVRAMRDCYGHRRVFHGIDLDPAARGLALCQTSEVGGFLDHRGSYGTVVGNPPYADAEAHVRHALDLVSDRRGVVAFLLRLAFLESQQRLPFWREHPAAKVCVLSKRPSFTGSGTDSAAYGFFVWDLRHDGPTVLEVV